MFDIDLFYLKQKSIVITFNKSNIKFDNFQVYKKEFLKLIEE